MKKLATTVRTLFTVSIITIAATACGSGNDKDAKDSTATKVMPKTEKVNDKGFAATTNIRFVDDTLLMQKYEFAKITLEECQKIALDLQNYQNSLGRQLQQKQEAIQKKLQSNGYLSEASYKADVDELAKFDQSCSAQYAKRAQADNKKIEDKTMALKNAIDNFIARYNQTHKFDAILYKSAALYYNPQLDITEDIAAGLNAEYKAAAESKK